MVGGRHKPVAPGSPGSAEDHVPRPQVPGEKHLIEDISSGQTRPKWMGRASGHRLPNSLLGDTLNAMGVSQPEP